MGEINTTKESDNIMGDLEGIRDSLPAWAIEFMDDVGAILKENLDIVTPIGETEDLINKNTVESGGDLIRFIYSTSDHFDPVVDGHMVYGPVFSDKQRKWWFWFLANFLGGVYEPKVGSGNRMMGNDYPSTAADMADGDIDLRASNFLDQITGGF